MSTNNSTNVPPEVLRTVLGVLSVLDVEMERVAKEDGAPAIHTHLEALNINLRKNPELIHLLTEEQIAPYYKAVVAQAELVLQPIKKKAAAAKAKKEDAVFVQDNIDNLFGF